MVTIRQARLPEDKPALLGFIEGLQRYEAEFESDRRLDEAYGEDQFAWLFKKSEHGVFFIAEADGRAVGWVLVTQDEAPPYVIERERHHATICELYVDEAVRGQGVGRALIETCEAWARARKLTTIHIGHLAENALAERSYDKAGYSPYVVLRRKHLK